MLDFLHPRKYKKGLVGILVVESGKVLSMIVKYTPEKKPIICHASRHSIESHGALSPERLEALMLSALHRSVEHLAKDGFIELSQNNIKTNELSEIMVFLGSPWHISTLFTAQKTSETPFLITKKTIEETLQENLKTSHPDLINVEQVVTDIKANGYTLKDPIGKKVKELHVSTFIINVDKKLITKMDEFIKLSFPNIHTSYHTVPTSLFSVVQNILKKDDFILFIPEHEVSDMVLIRNNRIEGVVTLPYGKHKVIRKISDALNMGIPESVSYFRLWKEGRLHEESAKDIANIVEEARQEWNKLLSESLWKLGQTVVLPRNIVVADNGVESKMMGEWILKDTYSNATLTLDNFEVDFFTFDDVTNLLDAITPKTKLNPLLGCLAIYGASV